MAFDGKEVLYANFNGVNGAVAHTAYTGQIATFSGNSKLDTSHFKFGTSSLLLNGSPDYIKFPHSADWDFGSGNFKIDFQVNFHNITGVKAPLAQFDSVYDRAWVIIYNAGNISFEYTTDGNHPIDCYSAWTPVIDTWYHFCVTKIDTTVRIFIDGIKLGADKTLSGTIFNSSGDLYLGRENISGYYYYFNGWIDELHISKGGTNYETSDFTPPARSYLARTINNATLRNCSIN